MPVQNITQSSTNPTHGDARAHFNYANTLQGNGKLDEAVAHYLKALAIYPDYAEAYNNMGIALLAQGNTDAAVDSYLKALSLKPDYAKAHNNLGNALQEQSNFDMAIEHYRKAYLLNPDYAEAHNNMGNALLALGQHDAAMESYHRALSLNPNYAEPYYNLGNALQAQAKLDAAIEFYNKALSLNPNHTSSLINLGKISLTQSNVEAAIEHYRHALMLQPNYAEAYGNLGVALHEQGKFDEAIFNFNQTLLIKPNHAETYNNLGKSLNILGNLDDAANCYRQALLNKPDFAEAHKNMGRVLQDQGKLDEAVECFYKALSFRSDYAEAYSNLIFLQGYSSSLTPQEYLALARGWEQSCITAEVRQSARGRIFQRAPLAGKRLKVGYVSGDLRQHPVSFFMEPLFTHHDRTRIELFAYSTHDKPDAVTARLKSLVDHWISIVGLPDQTAVERIKSDGIDVLIDLAGHTHHNRPGIFARRAAPVQAYYLGYFASTGLTEMDYWIGDDIFTPSSTDSHFNEQVWRLPRVSWSYDGQEKLPQNWHPASDKTVWVGSFNNLTKLTPATIVLCAKILHALPEGRLLLKTSELSYIGNRQRILDSLTGHGISPDRIELQDSSNTPDWLSHMICYDRLDIALDPVGAQGGVTTTCDALWMGVPVITLEGDRARSRATTSILNAIGHPEWVAHSEQDYIQKVVTLARDVGQRKKLRHDQRNRMASSPLCDPRSLAVSLENAYFEMFERWLNKRT